MKAATVLTMAIAGLLACTNNRATSGAPESPAGSSKDAAAAQTIDSPKAKTAAPLVASHDEDQTLALKERLLTAPESEKPSVVVQLGDLYFAKSRLPSTPDSMRSLYRKQANDNYQLVLNTERWSSYSPRDELLWKLAEVQREEGSAGAAQETCRKLVRTFPDSARAANAYLLLGDLMCAAGDAVNAQKAWGLAAKKSTDPVLVSSAGKRSTGDCGAKVSDPPPPAP